VCPCEPLHRLEELTALLLGGGSVTGVERAGDTMADVVVEQVQGETLESQTLIIRVIQSQSNPST
jgi:hypothetical protein